MIVGNHSELSSNQFPVGFEPAKQRLEGIDDMGRGSARLSQRSYRDL